MKTERYSAVAVLTIALIAVKAQDFYAFNSEATSLSNPHEIKFKVDTAKVTILVNSTNNEYENLRAPVEIYYRSENCHNCSYQYLSSITGEHGHYNKTFLISTTWKFHLTFIANLTKLMCIYDYAYHYGERGEYCLEFTIRDTELRDTSSCGVNLHIVKSPINSYIPILVAFAVLLALALIYLAVDYYFYKRKNENNDESMERFINSDLGITPADDSLMTPKPEKKRMKSIDSFRGVCIVIMVFVNYGGGGYWFFHHAAWHGLTVADLVFPWFMFIMGINIVLSIDSLERKATPPLLIAYKIVRRTLILFFLGLCIINHNTNFTNMRIPGVLQRFAIAYFVVTMLHWMFHKSVPDMNSAVVIASSDDGVEPWWNHIRDIKIYWIQWIVIFAFEVVWHCLVFLLPVKGCPTGYLGPGGLADWGEYFNCTGGAAGYIDRKVFGEAHMYGRGSARKIYFPEGYDKSIQYDPEGLLGTIHSILIVFLGLQAGKIYLYYKEPKARILRWLCWSLFLGVISAILTKCSQYDGWIPVNKNLWSTTFITTLSCFAFFILPVMYYVIDVKEYWSGVPFYFVGMNSIFIYVGHEVFKGYLPFAWGAQGTSSHAELLAMNMLGTAYWVIIAYYAYKIKFFVKI